MQVGKRLDIPVLAKVCPRYDAQNRSSKISFGSFKSSDSCAFSSFSIRDRKFFHSSNQKKWATHIIIERDVRRDALHKIHSSDVFFFLDQEVLILYQINYKKVSYIKSFFKCHLEWEREWREDGKSKYSHLKLLFDLGILFC